MNHGGAAVLNELNDFTSRVQIGGSSANFRALIRERPIGFVALFLVTSKELHWMYEFSFKEIIAA